MPESPNPHAQPPELPVKKKGGKTANDRASADTDEFPAAVPDFSAEFGDTEKKTPNEWQNLCARYCAGSKNYMKALMRELLTAEVAEERAEVLERMKVITDKLKMLRNDVGDALKETAAIVADIKTAEAEADKDFRHAAQVVNKEPDTPTLSADSPALGDVKTLIARSKRAYGTASVLHPRFPEVIALQEKKRAAKRRAAQQADAGTVPAHHAQEIDVSDATASADSDELTLEPTDGEQVVAVDASEFGLDTTSAPLDLDEALPDEEAQPLPAVSKPKAETKGQFALRWTGNIASVGIAPWLRARARKKAVAAQENED